MRQTSPVRLPALTLKQPWASAIFLGKDVENRSWPTDYRGPLIIHAGKTTDPRAYRSRIGRRLPHDLPAGAALGLVQIVGVETPQQPNSSPWGDRRSYRWRLFNPQPFPEPVPLRGQQGLFWPDNDELAAAVDALLRVDAETAAPRTP